MTFASDMRADKSLRWEKFHRLKPLVRNCAAAVSKRVFKGDPGSHDDHLRHAIRRALKLISRVLIDVGSYGDGALEISLNWPTICARADHVGRSR
jgi:hypothetical protein